MSNIVVAGPGAVGQVLGGMLALAGHDVTFLGRNGSPRVNEINSKGVRVNNLMDPSLNFSARARAVANLDGFGPADLVLLTTKNYNTEEVLPSLLPVIGEKTLLMSLQSGVESADKLKAFLGKGIILGACCFLGASLFSSGVVSLHSPIRVVVGDLDGTSNAPVHQVANTLRGAGIEAEESQDVLRDLWLKFLWDVGISQWCVIQDCIIGNLLIFREDVNQVHATMKEVVKVAQIENVNISEADIEPQIEAARKRFPLVIPSLLQDLHAGRPMEHDSLAGFISRQGEKHGIPTPKNDWLFYELNRRALVHLRAEIPVTSTSWFEGIVSGTHIGTRAEQQDSILVRKKGNVTITVISDGHGTVGGEVSRMAVEVFAASLEVPQEDRKVEESLTKAVLVTDQKIVEWQGNNYLRYASKGLDHSFYDSGATLVGLIRRGRDLWIAHLGDSRAYLVSRRKISVKQLTIDHRLDIRSLGHYWYKRSGWISATPDIIRVDDFEPGDAIVLSSDGLIVTDPEMIQIVLGNNCEEVPARLIETSFENGAAEMKRLSALYMDPKILKDYGIDNTTVIIVR